MSAEDGTVARFISNRFIRLFPVFWLCLLITVLLHIFVLKTSGMSFDRFMANATMVPSRYLRFGVIDGVYWTLWIELKFYAYIVVLLLLRLIKNFKLASAALITSFFLSFYFTAFIVIPEPSFPGATMLEHFFTLFFSDYGYYFFAGMLFYGVFKDRKKVVYLPGIFICYIVAIVSAVSRSYFNPSIDVAIVTGFFVLFFLIAYHVITNAPFQYLTRGRIVNITFLGVITYPLYLLHNILIASSTTVLGQFRLDNFFGFLCSMVFVLLVLVVVNSFDRYVSSAWKESNLISNFLRKTTRLFTLTIFRKVW
jgi:peptidoglycan/LPS O-acetylase OafA/YrhL